VKKPIEMVGSHFVCEEDGDRTRPSFLAQRWLGESGALIAQYADIPGAMGSGGGSMATTRIEGIGNFIVLRGG
jgi:hypothetical protein